MNAQSVINAERSWLVVRPFIKKKENPRLCSFGCRNQGITPAKIISASAKYVFVNIPDELWRKPPDYSFPVALPDLTLIVHHDSFPIGHGTDAESLIGDVKQKHGWMKVEISSFTTGTWFTETFSTPNRSRKDSTKRAGASFTCRTMMGISNLSKLAQKNTTAIPNTMVESQIPLVPC